MKMTYLFCHSAPVILHQEAQAPGLPLFPEKEEPCCNQALILFLLSAHRRKQQLSLPAIRFHPQKMRRVQMFWQKFLHSERTKMLSASLELPPLLISVLFSYSSPLFINECLRQIGR